MHKTISSLTPIEINNEHDELLDVLYTLNRVTARSRAYIRFSDKCIELFKESFCLLLYGGVVVCLAHSTFHIYILNFVCNLIELYEN